MSTPERIARYRFGPFELNPGQGTLTRNGMRIRIQDLPFRLLLMLVEQPDTLITREEVRQRLWPENTFLEFDNSLGVAIRKVRESLNDHAGSPQYVATIPRRGYRFIALVQPEKEAAAAEPAPRPVMRSVAVESTGLGALYLGIASLALAGLVGWGVSRFHSVPPRNDRTVRSDG